MEFLNIKSESTVDTSQYPSVTVTNDKKVYVTWQQYKDGQDKIYAGEIINDQLADYESISGEGQALRPVAISIGETVWYVWSEKIGNEWCIIARYYEDGKYSEQIEIDRDIALFYPSLFMNNDEVTLLYNKQGSGFSQSIMVKLEKDQQHEGEVVSVSSQTYRPTASLDNDGNLFLAYDVYNGERYDVVVRVKTENGWTDELKINNTSLWATKPHSVSNGKGATVVWYELGPDDTFNFCSADLLVEKDEVKVSDAEVITSGITWYHDINVAANDNGMVAFAYTWGKYYVLLRYKLANGEWSKPTLMSPDDHLTTTHPSVAVDKDNKVYLAWQFSDANGHRERNSSIVYGTATPEEIDQNPNDSVEKVEDKFTLPIHTDKKFDKHDEETTNAWLAKNGYENLQVVFGDIHGQSGISDGNGELDQYFHFATAVADLDFTALTDHDCYPDWISESEWEWIRTTNSLMNTDKLASLLAFEWTSNEFRYDYGHKNIYYRGDEGGLFRSGDPTGMTPNELFENVKKDKGMVLPHHTSADWGSVSAATDWDFHDPEVQRVVEIYSRHGNFETYESTSKYTKNVAKFDYGSVQDALAKGYRIGFIAGSDTHQLEHGLEGGIIGTFVPKLKREYVFDAIYDRFTYATTGARILVAVKINGHNIGEEINISAGEPVNVDISVLGTDALKVELIKNNKVVATFESDEAIDERYVDTDRTEDDYYYIRVTQEDEHMAWSSPIWVTAN